MAEALVNPGFALWVRAVTPMIRAVNPMERAATPMKAAQQPRSLWITQGLLLLV